MRTLFAGLVLVFVGLVGLSIAQDRLPGDIDGDGDVDFADFVMLAQNFGEVGGAEFDPTSFRDTIVVTETELVTVTDTVFLGAQKAVSEIFVQEEGWENIHPSFNPEFIRVLAKATRDILSEPMMFPLDSDIIVEPSTEGYPLILYARGKDADGRAGPHRIMLDIDRVDFIGGSMSSAQIIFQFAHEYAHALSNYFVMRGGVNQWFDEAICGIASLYVLRKMDSMIQNDEIELLVQTGGLTWLLNHTLKGDLTYYARRNFLDYGNRKDKVGFRNWFAENENHLRTDPYDYPKRKVVVASLYHIFEEYPQAWNTIRYLGIPGPVSWDPDQSFYQYLRGWYQRTPARWQPLVQGIADYFGYAVSSKVALPSEVDGVR